MRLWAICLLVSACDNHNLPRPRSTARTTNEVADSAAPTAFSSPARPVKLSRAQRRAAQQQSPLQAQLAPVQAVEPSSVRTIPPWMDAEAKLLVVRLHNAKGVSEDACRLMSGLILTEISNARGLNAIGESDINAALGLERMKDSLGCSTTTCIAELGGALGVDFVLHGELGQIGNALNLNVSILHVKSMRVRARESRMVLDSEDVLARELHDVVYTLVSKMNE